MEEQKKIILVFVGMPGAGKTEAASYLDKKGIPFVRFGQITDEGLKEQNLPLTPENERVYREQLRKTLGMGAYAIKAKPKIDQLLQSHDVIAIDGMYSWGEYTYLKEQFPGLILIHVYAEPKKRYNRLVEREIRPVPVEKSRTRDISEIEKLDKGGPIAIADYLIDNDADFPAMYHKIDILLGRLGISE